ncbi:cell division protein FtsA [Desulfurispira natronophila]|uniref:Cell division protein FtsA n=1 Tax=Desulfurispira natronophila TaxID=682562 RepID=A0A7W8DH50_9BACT|nr:cell division protein FtsA [Desulfurispira natronophila]MBB5022140.1 cell division protein FtsA [Desulfurispira natronophila]
MSKDAAEKKNILVGLDIGTTKVSVVVGQVKSDASINIIGIGRAETRGIRKGVVVNIDQTVDAIRKAVNEAQLMAGVTIRDVYVSIAGAHTKGINSRGVIAIKNREVSQEDIDRVIESARAVDISLDRQIIHVLPQEYVVDGQDSIKDPLGMSGVRLEIEVHIVTASKTSIENLFKSCTRAGLNILSPVLSQLATSYAVLAHDERDLGVAVVDIGGGTTDVAIIVEGSPWHTCSIPFGGVNITNDIAIALKTPFKEAERIKVSYGCASIRPQDENAIVEVPGVGGREPKRLSRYVLSQIMNPRLVEILGWVKKEIVSAGLEDRITSGIVLTGGTSQLEGASSEAAKVFGTELRSGVPAKFGGLVDIASSPEYSTAVGLVLYAATENPYMLEEHREGDHGNLANATSGSMKKIGQKAKKLFDEFF